MAEYTTSRIAKIAGIHPNTVRLYEQIGFITPPERKQNGYRAFTDLHVLQVQLVRAALGVELVQNGLRKEVLAIIETMAQNHYDEALALTDARIAHLRRERFAAEHAANRVRGLLARAENSRCATVIGGGPTAPMRRQEAADYLDTTIDALRNWEMNGLFQAKRKQNGYRIYTAEDLNRLAIIRALRVANYSLTAILRMLAALDHDAETDIEQALDTPKPDEDILSACDQLLTSLDAAEYNAHTMMDLLQGMKEIS